MGKIFIHSCPYFSLFSYLFVFFLIVVVVNLWDFFIYLGLSPFLVIWEILSPTLACLFMLLMVSANKYMSLIIKCNTILFFFFVTVICELIIFPKEIHFYLATRKLQDKFVPILTTIEKVE